MDVNGYAVHLLSVTARNTHDGVIEGNPYLERKWRVVMGRKWMEQPGHLVHAIDEIERELAAIDSRHAVWGPNERWEAVVADQIDFEASTQRVLTLRWYQEGGDPMARLQEIIAGLDFRALAVAVPVDLSD
ncbi:hypothetical protein [Roseateles noduli]|uniref:hypothetical protein n=1 Tax=Roseateles noduli TaxID=2052484 RepID=UPI003D658BAB